MDIKNSKGYVAIAGLGFIAGVAITGIRAESNLSKVSQDLADHGLRIDRCPEGVEVKKIEDFPCREVGSTADGIALKAKQEKEKEEKLMNKTGESK